MNQLLRNHINLLSKSPSFPQTPKDQSNASKYIEYIVILIVDGTGGVSSKKKEKLLPLTPSAKMYLLCHNSHQEFTKAKRNFLCVWYEVLSNNASYYRKRNPK